MDEGKLCPDLSIGGQWSCKQEARRYATNLCHGTKFHSLGISLRGLNKTFLGNVYIDGKPICDDKWDLLDAQVVCNQLGLGPAIAATKRSFFGLAEEEFGIDNVECIGSENSILDCELSKIHNCDQNEAAGVICSSINIYRYLIK